MIETNDADQLFDRIVSNLDAANDLLIKFVPIETDKLIEIFTTAKKVLVAGGVDWSG